MSEVVPPSNAGKSETGPSSSSEKGLNFLLSKGPAVLYQGEVVEGRLFLQEASANISRLTGFSSTRLVAEPGRWLDQVHPEDRESVETKLSEVGQLAGYVLKYRFLNSAGHWLWIRDEVEVQEHTKQGARLLGMLTDVTHAKSSFSELEKQEALFRSAFDRSPIGVLVGDPQGNFTQANTAINTMLGFEAGELIGKHFLEITHPEQRQEAVELWQSLMTAPEDSMQIEQKLIGAQGQTVWSFLAVTLVRNPDRSVEHMVGSVIDLTDRVEATKALAESESRFRRMCDQAPIFIWQGNNQLEPTYANRHWLDFLGLPADAVAGRPWQEAVHPGDANGVLAAWQKIMDSDRPLVMRCRVRRYDGVYRWVESSIQERTDKDGNRLGFIGCSFDIEDRVQLERDQKAFQEQLERRVQQRTQELQRAHIKQEETLQKLRSTQLQVIRQERLSLLGQMASGIAHDLNNSLAPVVGLLEVFIEDSNFKGEERQLLDDVLTGAKDATAVVKGLQGLYRQTQPDEDAGTAIDTKQVLDRIPNLTRSKWRDEAQSHGQVIDFIVDLEPTPPVFGNEPELRQVVTNLVFNAVDAMPGGGTLTLRSYLVGEEVLIEVKDTGVGMTDVQAKHCFDPFFTEKLNGFGLGLSVAQSSIERQGGRLEVSSRSGRGSTFTISLPVYKESLPAQGAQAEVAQSDHLRILLIDDNDAVRRALEQLLSRLGQRVTGASNGEKGLLALRDQPFDLIITDLGMDGMDGCEVCIEANKIQPGVPVVVASGWSQEQIEDRFHEEGAEPPHSYLQKPVTLASLRALLDKMT